MKHFSTLIISLCLFSFSANVYAQLSTQDPLTDITALPPSTHAQIPQASHFSSDKVTNKKDLFLIIESGNLNSHVFIKNEMIEIPMFTKEDRTTPKREKGERGFFSPNENWVSMRGFSASLKVGKSLSNIFDSKIGLDFITGLSYKQANIFQKYYNGHPNSLPGILLCIDLAYERDINIKSIEIPLELRTNIPIQKFTISPILGVAIDIPISKKELLYHPTHNNAEASRGIFISENKLESSQKYNYSTISKLELSYLLPNNQKLKIAAFYNINITTAISIQLSPEEGSYTSGLQIAYEIPLTQFND